MNTLIKYTALSALGALAATSVAHADNSIYSSLIRQKQQTTGVEWDMPVNLMGDRQAPQEMEEGGALFQLWTINTIDNGDFLLDQKLVGAYLPKSTVTITALDEYDGVPRTRIDQPFTVTIETSNLLSGSGIPNAAKYVFVERHLSSDPDGSLAIPEADAIANSPYSSGYIGSNGDLVLQYDASALQAPERFKAGGKEYFVTHMLRDGTFPQTQIGAAHIQVWPKATGEFTGISDGDIIRGEAPVITVRLEDLYPDSDTYLLLTDENAAPGEVPTIILGSQLVLDQEFPEDRVLNVDEYSDLFQHDGDYTIELFSDTPFGRESFGSANFTVNRAMRVNAMQVDGLASAP